MQSQKTPTSKTPPMVLVTYEDMSWSSAEYTDKDAKNMSPILLQIVGFLQREDEGYIVLSREWRPDTSESSEWRHLIALPKVGIKSMSRLRSRQNHNNGRKEQL